MKKVILNLAFILTCFMSYSQWIYKTVNNGFDDPYKIAYTTASNGAILKLEKVDDAVAFYLTGGYHCEDDPIVDLVFVVNGVDDKYYSQASTSDDRQTVFIIDDILVSNALDSFKACTALKVRINEVYCDTDIYIFNMKNSTAALNYVKQ